MPSVETVAMSHLTASERPNTYILSQLLILALSTSFAITHALFLPRSQLLMLALTLPHWCRSENTQSKAEEAMDAQYRSFMSEIGNDDDLNISVLPKVFFTMLRMLFPP